MIVLVNIGNTSIRAAICDEKKSKFKEFFIATNRVNSEREFIDFIEYNAPNVALQTLSGGVVSSVVPEKTQIIENAFAWQSNKKIERFNARNCKVDTSLYDGLLGEDRIACLLGALKKHKPPFMLIDFGTVTTVNIVNANARFVGGAILAGVNTLLKTAPQTTAQLPNIHLDKIGKIKPFGANTKENLISGAVFGLSFAVSGYVTLAKKDFGENLPVIITGGHSKEMSPHLDFEKFREPSVLLEGLLEYYKEIT